LQQQSAIQLAKTYVDEQKSELALEILNRLLEEESIFVSRNELQFQLARAYIQKKEYEVAKEILESVLEQALQNEDQYLVTQCYDYLGTIEYAHQEYMMAIHHWNMSYRQALASDLSDPFQIGQIAQRLSQVHEKLGMYEQSKRYLLDSFEWFKTRQLADYAIVYRELAEQCHEKGEFTLALDYSAKASALHTYANVLHSFIQSQIYYAKTIHETGQKQKALTILKECLELSTRYRHTSLLYLTNVTMAQIYFADAYYQEALQSAEEAWKQVQEGSLEQADILFLIGEIERNLQHDQQANDRFEQAATLYETHRAYQKLVQTYLQLGTLWNEKDPVKAAAYMDKMRDALELSLQERNIVSPTN
jgi:tetratricopeptide (TPR) repeat protein